MVLTPAEKGMLGIAAEQLVAETPNAIMLQQFENPANPAIHKATTVEEIWEDTDGQVDIFVAGVSTGGTITGVGSALKPRKEGLRAVAVELISSPVISEDNHPIRFRVLSWIYSRNLIPNSLMRSCRSIMNKQETWLVA